MGKFLEKNKENLDKLNSFIDEKKDSIRCVIASVELFEYLKEFNDDKDHILENTMRYRGIRIISDCYFPSNLISFAFKDTDIRFDVPCLCGIYKGEKHP